MKPYLLAIHTTLFFALIIVVVLIAAMLWFVHIAGHEVVADLAALRGYQGIDIAREFEAEFETMRGVTPGDTDGLAENLAEHSDIKAFLESKALDAGLRLALRTESEKEDIQARRGAGLRSWTFVLQNRTCLAYGPPIFETWVPVHPAGRSEASYLVVRGPLNSREFHITLHNGLVRIGAVALLCSILLAIYVTAPLRRMSRSMDRVAAGDLEHRVAIRGSNEVAVMGSSFNAMTDRIQTLITRQKELMAGVSHEFRSPLTRMKLSLELLRSEQVGEPRICDLENEIDTLDALVEELLLASRFELGTVPLQREWLSLDTLADTAWTRVAETATTKGIVLKLVLAVGAETIWADRFLMVRVLGNLFENAVRYAGEGRVELSSRTLRGEDDSGRIEVSCCDEGPGVEDQEREHLFEPFYRVDPSRSRATGASGLGLMIVKRAIEAQGGCVHASSGEGGRGFCVTFDLPVR